jgi:glycosyltransferase involved in cell wall biosynthesis
MTPRISVVIPTRNRPGAIVSCLDALAEQTMPPGSFEVVVVDDGSTSPLIVDPARWVEKFPLMVIRQGNTGPAGARNRGVAESRGEIIAFTDDDCLPTPGWLETMVASLEENPEALVGGSTINDLPCDLFAETSQLVLDMVYEHFNSSPEKSYFFASNNIMLRYVSYLECGGFNVSFTLAAAEDREFCDRWRMQQRPMIWSTNAVIRHRHPQNLLDFSKLHFRYGHGAFLYQSIRHKRGSGSIHEDLNFHRCLPWMVLEKTARYSVPQRIMILAGLLLWQIANFAGFLSASIHRR